MFDLGMLGGANSQAYDVNDAGEVVGVAQTNSCAMHAFVFTVDANGAVIDRIDLGELGGGFSYAYGVNGSGDVVGTSDGRDTADRGSPRAAQAGGR